MIVDPENIGMDTFFVLLYAILAEKWWKIDISIMAAVICILNCQRHMW